MTSTKMHSSESRVLINMLFACVNCLCALFSLENLPARAVKGLSVVVLLSLLILTK